MAVLITLPVTACAPDGPIAPRGEFEGNPAQASPEPAVKQIVHPLGFRGPAAVTTPWGPVADTIHSDFDEIRGYAAPDAAESSTVPTFAGLQEAGAKVTNHFLVRFKHPNRTSTRETNLRAALPSATFKEALGAFRAAGAEILLVFNHHGSALVRIPPESLATLMKSKFVDDIIADGPTDKILDGDSIHWSIPKIAVQQVWDSTNGKGQARVVHMVETGYTLHYDHNNLTCTSYEADYCEAEDGGHGTRVTGTFTAPLNGYGTVGAAPAPGYIYIWDAYTDSGYTQASLSWAYNQILGYSNQVVNMSYSGTSSAGWESTYMADLWSDGAILVASAGNTGTEGVRYPAGYSNVLGVAGSNSDDSRGTSSGACSVSSSYGSHVDLVAPFYSYTTMQTGLGDYDVRCGNSHAAPRVAGVAAIVWSIHNTETNTQIVARLTGSADSLSWSGSGYGLVDAWDAAY